MRNSTVTTAYVAIGSNQGDRARYCYSALQQIAHHDQITVIHMSPLIETPPIGSPEFTAPFLNGAIQLDTTLGSHALLHELQAIENRLGRTRREKGEARVIDLDLLLYGDKIVSSDELIVPHPFMHQRRFVLEPLAVIAPDAVHPVLQITVRGLLEDLKA